ncbi:MAG: hypothetical protein Q7T87_05765 [Polaromonas sp.]|nr:hypothetical protein [Polaromonas sp.]
MSDQQTETDAQCRQVLDRFMDALNQHDAQGMDKTMHFPHYRHSGGHVKVYAAPGSNPMDLFSRLQKDDNWLYSTWRTRHLVQFDERKAHYALSYTRFRADHSVIGIYESLYVLTRVDGAWGIQMRSSFGP